MNDTAWLVKGTHILDREHQNDLTRIPHKISFELLNACISGRCLWTSRTLSSPCPGATSGCQPLPAEQNQSGASNKMHYVSRTVIKRKEKTGREKKKRSCK